MSTPKKLPWYRRFVSDWRAGTRGMSMELKGFYNEFLDAQWDVQGQLPLDEKKLAMAFDCNPRTVRSLLPELIKLGKVMQTATGYYNARMMKDILGVDTLPVGIEFDVYSTPIQLEFDPNSTPIRSEFELKVPENLTITTRDLLPLPLPPHTVEVLRTLSETSSDVGQAEALPKKIPRRKPYPEAFETFWRAYPETAGMSKVAALNSWNRLDSAERQQATDALPAFKADLAKRRAKSSDATPKHAQGYLSQKRFETLVDTATQSGNHWTQDPEKVASITIDQWRGSIAKFANGSWSLDRLGYWPSHAKCIVPRELIDELGLIDKYDTSGHAKGDWKLKQDQLHEETP